ncbi:MAG: WecB/TagA/CpsF family glycosyltransferase [Lachnospiraceae bacterium]|nr:WecB/TagA/CpsF family glycosyltransferase [Lachnospiraceae bacterium]
MKRQRLLNTYVSNLTMTEAVKAVDDLLLLEKKSYIVAVNVDVLTKIEADKKLAGITKNADIVLVDGKPLVWFSKLEKRPVKEKISGSDFVPTICRRAAETNRSIFILGGKDGVAEKAKRRLCKKYPKLKIVGTYAPPIGFEKDIKENDKINKMISAAKPDILIVCLGCPKQEKWISDNINKYDAKLSVCAGATVDFLAGNVKRAPRWMSDFGLEWFYRFTQEPKRLFKRYFVDDLKIIKIFLKYKDR